MTDDLFKYLGGLSLPLGDGETLLHQADTRAVHRLDSLSLDLLEGCRAFRTLDAHAESVRQAAGLLDEDLPVLRDRLAALARAGVLASRSDLQGLLRPDPDPPRVAVLGVLGDGPGLARAAEIARNIELLAVGVPPEKLRSLPGRPLLADAGAYRDALSREAGLSAELALPDDSAGARWNLLLLHAAGDALLAVHPAVELQPADLGDPGLAFSAGGDPLDVRPGTDVPPADLDVLAAHEALLGRTLNDCAARHDVDWESLDAFQLRRLRAGDARVGLTQSGYAGDCGEDSPAWRLLREDAARLAGSPQEYAIARSSAAVVARAPRTTLSSRPFSGFYAAGLDHRSLLPPFPPGLPNPDPLFAAVFGQAFPRSYAAHLPWTVRRGTAARAYGPDSLRAAFARPSLTDVLIACVESIDLGPAKPDGRERLRALGTHLRELAALPPEEFEDLARKLLWLRAGHALDLFEDWMVRLKGDAPLWTSDLRVAIAALRGCFERAGPAAAPARESVAAFGRLLHDWPDLVNAAKALRRRDVRPGRPA